MNAEADARSDERLKAALERLASIQRSILELNHEANRIRRYIRDFDVNLDALNILANVQGKDEKGGGVQVLEDLIRYARQTGTHLEAHGESGGTSQTPGESARPAVERSMEHVAERESGGLLKLLSQLAVAIVVTLGLFVLIH